MATISENHLTVVLRVTDAQWGRRAAAAALMLYEHGACPDRVMIRHYDGGGGRAERVSSGYDWLADDVTTPWLLCLDADSHVYDDVGILVDGIRDSHSLMAMRPSPLQTTPRDGWDEEGYRALFEEAELPYRPLGTTCAFLMWSEFARNILPSIAEWREWVDERGKFSQHYHNAQVAFALACAAWKIRDDSTWWWGPEELSFSGEPHGIIHHEALSHYKFPFKRATEV